MENSNSCSDIDLILTYLVILPKSIAEDSVLMEEVAKKRSDIPSSCFHKLFSIDKTQLMDIDYQDYWSTPKNPKIAYVWVESARLVK